MWTCCPSQVPCLSLCQQLGPSAPRVPHPSPWPSPHKAGSGATLTKGCWPAPARTLTRWPSGRDGISRGSGAQRLTCPSPPRRYYKVTSGLMLDVGGYMKALEVPARSPPCAPGFLEEGACSVALLVGLPLPCPRPRPVCSCSPRPVLASGYPSMPSATLLLALSVGTMLTPNPGHLQPDGSSPTPHPPPL